METKIIITGATGFVGRNLVKKLNSIKKEHNLKIVEVSRSKIESENEVVVFDIISSKLEEPIQCDYLIHCAGFIDSHGEWEDFYNANVVGLQNTLQNLQPTKAIVYVSTSSVYTGQDIKNPYHEKDKLVFDNLNYYSASKLQAEQIIRELSDKHFIIRPHIIYGEDDTTLIPKLREGSKFGRLILPASGEAETSVTNIKNLVEFISMIVTTNSNNFGIYNFSDQKTYKIQKIINDISKKLQLKSPIFIKLLGSDFSLRLIEFISKKIGRKNRIDKYLVNSIQKDHILNLSRLKDNFGNYKEVETWEKYISDSKIDV